MTLVATARYNAPIMSAPQIEVYPLEALAPAAATWLAATTQRAVQRRGKAHIALSGGSTPRSLFRLLATPEWQSRVPWPHIHIWWADERGVAPDHHDSNYGAAYALLLSHLSVANIHRMRGEMDDAVAAARAYEMEMRHAFNLGPRGRPRFDLILLGMGADGHTASLFPGTAALAEHKALVTVGWAPVAPHRRLTLTLPVLNRAACCIFLAAGADKGPALAQVLRPDPSSPPLPAARVNPSQGRVIWLLDTAAAGLT